MKDLIEPYSIAEDLFLMNFETACEMEAFARHMDAGPLGSATPRGSRRCGRILREYESRPTREVPPLYSSLTPTLLRQQ